MPNIDFEMLEAAASAERGQPRPGLSAGSVTSEYDVHPAALPSRAAAGVAQRWLADGLTDKFLILDERAVVTAVQGDGTWLITDSAVVELARRIWRNARARARPLDRFGTLSARQRAIALRLIMGDYRQHDRPRDGAVRAHGGPRVRRYQPVSSTRRADSPPAIASSARADRHPVVESRRCG